MTLIIQDDTGTVDGANSYATVQEFKDYWTARGVDCTGLATEVIEALLIPARDYLDNRYKWKGCKLNGYAQDTEFPRDDLYVYSFCGSEAITGIPKQIKTAQIEYAKIQKEQGALQPNQNINGAVKRTKEQIGSLVDEVEYMGGGQTGGVISYPQADNKVPSDFYINTDGVLFHG